MKPVSPSKVYRLLYPAVPAIISCYDRGFVFAMPVVTLVSLSNDPPLVGFSSSPSHATHKAVAVSRCFSVSWVDSSMAKAVETLGTTPHTTSDKLQAAGLKHTRGKLLDVPIIEGAVAYLECSLYGRQALGDHELLIGRVQEASATEDFGDYWGFQTYQPILYTGIREGSLQTYRPGGSPQGT